MTERRRLVLIATLACILAVLAPFGALVAHRGSGDRAAASMTERSPSAAPSAGSPRSRASTSAGAGASASPAPAALPGGRSTIFGGHRFLVAYYGTAGTGALGVLGKTSPATMQRHLARAGRAFVRAGRPVQLVYELIVSIADRHPGKDHDYSHDLQRKQVLPYIRAAHRNNALLLLDLQTGHSDFLTVAKRWRWALEDPWVGLALDPEWRMAHGAVPGRVIGHVTAGEINRTSAWLAGLVARRQLPQKLLVLHQFRTTMIQHIGRVERRPGLAMVQHVDGFGTPGEKKATFHAVAKPKRFTLGFKLFYRADVHRMSARDVFRLRPRVRFVSFQ
ncbi:hypothetical protein [Nocardioides sp. Iso805N]|uniref:hypothetical protein n=1 Tax=Nocardioides sp. Iso805N TaxID=1283287 RepID=UPI00036A59F1|nr:hypothetical protein [Nocardioides sp. Iso805N]